MEFAAESPRSPYINRRPSNAHPMWRGRLETLSGRHSGRRAVDRMRVALLAYEQRAQRRAAMREWVLERRAPPAGTHELVGPGRPIEDRG